MNLYREDEFPVSVETPAEKVRLQTFEFVESNGTPLDIQSRPRCQFVQKLISHQTGHFTKFVVNLTLPVLESDREGLYGEI